MMNLAIWLKKNGFRADQVQTFYPSPMATATAMYHTGRNPLRGVRREVHGDDETVDVVRGEKRRRLHKAFLRYHDANNWPLLREALKTMGRADLIGNGKHHLIPTWQPLTDCGYQSAPQEELNAAGRPSRTGWQVDASERATADPAHRSATAGQRDGSCQKERKSSAALKHDVGAQTAAAGVGEFKSAVHARHCLLHNGQPQASAFSFCSGRFAPKKRGG
jgi:hypothetical protein